MWMVIAAIVVVGGAFALDQYWNVLPAKTAYSSPVVSTPSINTSNATLADNDWQKVLVGAGVGSSAKNGSLNSGTASTKTQPLTETAKIGQVLVSDYLQLQQSGQPESTDTIDAMVSQALSDPNIVPQTKVYSFSDIKIGKDDSISASIAYGQNLGALFKNNNAVGNEATYARDSVEQNDPSILNNIDPIIASYKNILNGLLGMTAPPSIASMHLDLVNAMSERLSVAELLRMVNTDPAAGLEGAGQYLNALQDLSNAFGEIKQYFDTLKVDSSTATTTSSIPDLNNQ
jgi:hypothetical protein